MRAVMPLLLVACAGARVLASSPTWQEEVLFDRQEAVVVVRRALAGDLGDEQPLPPDRTAYLKELARALREAHTRQDLERVEGLWAAWCLLSSSVGFEEGRKNSYAPGRKSRAVAELLTPLAAEVHASLARVLGEEHPMVARAQPMEALARAYRGEFALARSLLASGWEGMRRVFGPGSSHLTEARMVAAALYRAEVDRRRALRLEEGPSPVRWGISPNPITEGEGWVVPTFERY